MSHTAPTLEEQLNVIHILPAHDAKGLVANIIISSKLSIDYLNGLPIHEKRMVV